MPPGAPVPFSSVTLSCPTLRPHGLQRSGPPCPSPAPGVYGSTDTVGRVGGGSHPQTRVQEPLLSPSSQTLSPGKPLLGGSAGDRHWAPRVSFTWGCTLRHRPQCLLLGPPHPATSGTMAVFKSAGPGGPAGSRQGERLLVRNAAALSPELGGS